MFSYMEVSFVLEQEVHLWTMCVDIVRLFKNGQRCFQNFTRICGLVDQIARTAPIKKLLEKYSTVNTSESTDNTVTLRRTMSTYNRLKCPELKQLLRVRMLPISGTKDELIIRLVEDDSRRGRI